MVKRICLNRKVFFRTFSATLSLIFTIISFIFLFFTVDDFEIDTIWRKILALMAPAFFAFLFAFIRTFAYSKNKILDESQRKVIIRYGNLWKFAFPKREKNKRIVVVNVNTTFDTIVDPPGTDKALVSAGTVHGQWLEQMELHGVDREDIAKAIRTNLNDRGIEPISTIDKKRGNCKNYPRGTIACYIYKNTTFYLLALSEFDENNNAQNSVEDLRKTIVELIDFIGNNSQKADVYIPVMGAGMSRTGIDDSMALEILKSNLLIYKEKYNGEINVVVYEGHRDKVSIDS